MSLLHEMYIICIITGLALAFNTVFTAYLAYQRQHNIAYRLDKTLKKGIKPV